MNEIDIAGLRALADTVERYEDGQAIHTSGDETCVDDCAACQYEGAAGRVLPELLDRLERYKEATEELRSGDGTYYLTEERAMAPGIADGWPYVIKAPHTKNGRLVKRVFSLSPKEAQG